MHKINFSPTNKKKLESAKCRSSLYPSIQSTVKHLENMHQLYNLIQLARIHLKSNPLELITDKTSH
jgi:hypothetical protein